MLDVHPVRAFLTKRHIAFAAAADRFATTDIAALPGVGEDEAARVQARQVLKLLGGAWLQPIRDQDLRACCLMREALAAASPLADAVFALQALGATPLVLAGTDEQRARWLEPALAGTALAAFAMTEPGAGSDVASLNTRAQESGEGFVLNGAKSFISNAGIADFYVVFATLDPSQRHRGIACFLVPADTPGLRFVGPQVMSAPHPLGDIAFNDCRLPRSALLAPAGEGFKLGLATLDRLRATVAAAACGMAARALREALDHAKRRHQFGKPLGEFQLVQDKVARMAIDLTAARLLTYRAAWERDEGAERVTLESAMAKAFATEAAQRVIDHAVQILGGTGVLASHPVERLYRSIRALRIYEGTTEIQHLIIAGKLLDAVNDPHA